MPHGKLIQLKIKTEISMSLARVSNSLGLTNWDFKKLCTFWYDPVGILKNPKFEIVGSRWVGVNNISSFLFLRGGKDELGAQCFSKLSFIKSSIHKHCTYVQLHGSVQLLLKYNVQRLSLFWSVQIKMSIQTIFLLKVQDARNKGKHHKITTWI